jgi:hypothetical protein
MRQAFAAIAIVILSGAAVWGQGCGPTRLKVVERVALDMPPGDLWRLVGNFQDMSWAGNTTATVGSGADTPDKAVRHVTLVGGKTLDESLYKYDADTMSYSYHIDKLDTDTLPVQNASVTVEVLPGVDRNKSILQWRAAFYRFLKPGEPAPDVADAQAAKSFRTMLQRGLAALRARGEPKT